MTNSIWEISTSKPLFGGLQENAATDIAIVGGGITGLMAAWQLHEAGFKVCLLEGRLLGSGVTGHSTAHITSAIDGRYRKLVSDHGVKRIRKVVQATLDAQQLIKRLSREENIACDFQQLPGYYFAENQKQAELLVQEQQAAARVGLPFSNAQLPEQLAFKAIHAARVEEQAQVHPLKLIYGLARKLTEQGVPLYENSRVISLKRSEGSYRLCLENGSELAAEKIILATHSPLFLDPVQTLVAPYRSYVLEMEVPYAPEALLWDLADPYHYIRPIGNNRILLGGSDHKTGQADAEHLSLEALRQFASTHFPRARVSHCWSGQVFEPADGLPYIGESPMRKHIYIATGFSGDGILWGSYAGSLFADIFRDRLNPLIDIFSPSRLRLKGSVSDFVRENVNVGKHFLIDRFSADSPEVQDVPKGEGRLIRQGLQQYAVYRDPTDELHVLSPTCPHMLCVVQWNDVEKTWDCPCHGGRFSATGEVIEGPPTHNLTAKKLKKL